MKVLIAGATGAIGIPLSSTLRAAGHEILGITRSPAGAAKLRAAGVQPVIADAMDRSALLTAVDGVSADAVVHQLTALAKAPAKHRDMTQTNRLRTEGTKNLLDVARATGAGTFVTQSIVLGYGYTDHGDKLITEDDPFGQPNSGKANPHVAAMLANEDWPPRRRASSASPCGTACSTAPTCRTTPPCCASASCPSRASGTTHCPGSTSTTPPARPRPLSSSGAAGAYNIVDDKPASWSEMFTDMATTLGTPAPRSLPAGLIRLAAPYVSMIMLDTQMRVSNAKAKSELQWKPEYPTLTEGLCAMKAQLRG